MPAGRLEFSTGIAADTLRQIAELLDGVNFRGRAAGAVALQAAIAKTLVTGEARIARAIAAIVNLRIRDIKGVIDSKKGNYDDPTGLLIVTRKASWLSDFLTAAQIAAARVRRRGRGQLQVRVRNKQGSYRLGNIIPRGFAGFMPRNPDKVGIFQREGQKRTPLHRLRGPTALGIFLHASGDNGEKVIDDIVDELSEVLEANALQQLGRFL